MALMKLYKEASPSSLLTNRQTITGKFSVTENFLKIQLEKNYGIRSIQLEDISPVIFHVLT